jgi:hypothetical protein
MLWQQEELVKKKDSSSDINTMVDSFELDTLRKENEILRKRLAQLEKTLESYDIEEIETITDVEYICIEEIKKLKALSDAGGLSDVDVKNLDLLHKNLRQVRGQESSKKKPKEKPASVAEL